LILTDGSPHAQATVAVAGQLARQAHARTTLLGYGQNGETLQRHLQEVKEQLGSGLAALDIHTTSNPPDEAVLDEVDREPCDLVVLSAALPNSIALAEKVFQAGDHHLLLLPPAPQVPQRALICIAKGEPGKEDVLFAGRLIRHLGAEATLLTVLSELEQVPQSLERTQYFLDNGVRTLELLGVPAQTAVHVGTVMEGIVSRLNEDHHDLLVVGAPLPDIDGKIVFSGLIGQLLRNITDRPILLVRSARQVGQQPVGRGPRWAPEQTKRRISRVA
jgi:sulfate/thiosulfate transport system ATP-binding protein